MANRAGLKIVFFRRLCEIPSLRGSWVQIPLPPLDFQGNSVDRLSAVNSLENLHYLVSGCLQIRALSI